MLNQPVVALLILSVFATGCNRPTAVVEKKADTGPIEISTASAKMREVQRSVDGIGTLFPMEEVVVSAEIDGKIDQVKVDIGDPVEPNQILARISEEEQKYVVATNEAQLRQSLERLGLKNENDKVKDIKQTPEVRKAQADVTESEQRYTRTRQLVEQGIGPKTDLDQAASRRTSAIAAYDATLNQTRNLIQEVERFKAMLELQRKKLRDTTIYAPFRAFVKDRQITLGQYVKANTPMFTLVKIDPVRLRIDVPERMAPWVRTKQVVTVSLEAFEGRQFTGIISRISPTVDQNKRTFMVEALINNPKGELKPGSYARAHLPTQKVERVTLVPTKAVNYVLGSNKAYVVKDGKIEAREVKLGERFDQDIEILEGISDGDQVATSQLTKLDTGASVRVAKATKAE